jgi:hypothetical protein
MKLAKIFLLCCFWLLTTQAQSQEVDTEEFRVRATEMIKQLQNNLSLLGSKEQPQNVKQFYIGETMKFFINQGQGVSMEVSSVRNGIQTVRSLSMEQYLRNLTRLTYAKVKIEFGETFYISNLYPVGNNKYEATASVTQKFCGYAADGRAKYCDTTKKTIRIHLERISDAYGERWAVLLGDISVAQTSAD